MTTDAREVSSEGKRGSEGMPLPSSPYALSITEGTTILLVVGTIDDWGEETAGRGGGRSPLPLCMANMAYTCNMHDLTYQQCAGLDRMLLRGVCPLEGL